LATRGISPAHNRHLGPREGFSERWTQLDKICGGAAPSATRCVPKSLPPLSHRSGAMSRVKLYVCWGAERIGVESSPRSLD
jgi:hypothetical protein